MLYGCGPSTSTAEKSFATQLLLNFPSEMVLFALIFFCRKIHNLYFLKVAFGYV